MITQRTSLLRILVVTYTQSLVRNLKDLTYHFHKSRKMKPIPKTERVTIPQANLVIMGEDDSESLSTDGLRISMEYIGGRGIKEDNYTNQ